LTEKKLINLPERKRLGQQVSAITDHVCNESQRQGD